MKNFKFIIGAIISLAIGILTCTGHTQMVIHFAGVLNEIGFTVACFGFTILSLSGISFRKEAV